MKKLINKFSENRLVKKVLDCEPLMQVIKFGIVGFSNTVISYVIYLLVLWAMKPLGWRFDYVVGYVVAFILSVLWSFFWNSKYVFKSAENETRVWWKALLKTYVSYAFSGLFLDTLLGMLLVELLHVPKEISPIICLLVTVPVNFVLTKFWAFKGKKVEE